MVNLVCGRYDLDGTGLLHLNELQELCERLGKKMNDDEVAAMLNSIDSSGDMEADEDEFVQWWIHHGGRNVQLPQELADARLSVHAEGDMYLSMEIGAYVEMMTYGFGILLYFGTAEMIPYFADVSAAAILIVTCAYSGWCFHIGLKDEFASRRAEKSAVAHILFREYDTDGTGRLDAIEVRMLCERLGKEMTDSEIDKMLQEVGGDDMEIDADEFVNWWVTEGGRKISLPDDLLDLADHAGDRLNPTRGCPFRKPNDFRVDDEVRWFKEDDDVPKGAIGHVVGFKPGRTRMAPGKKRKERGPVVQSVGRIYVAWPSQKYFAMPAHELLLYSGKRTVPIGADWRGNFPKVDALDAQDTPTEEKDTAGEETDTPGEEKDTPGEEKDTLGKDTPAAPYSSSQLSKSDLCLSIVERD